MKAENFVSPALLFCFFGLLVSCEKKKTVIPEDPDPITTEIASGLPQNQRKLNGYLYASIKTTKSFGSGAYLSANQYAVFGDPTKDLLSNYNHVSDQEIFNFENDTRGNVLVGEVRFNNLQLMQNGFGGSGGSFSYRSFNNSSMSEHDDATNWATEGNGSFKSINFSIPRGFPVLQTSPAYTVDLSAGVTIDISNMSNYDSLRVRISNSNSPATNQVAQKIVTSGATSVTFTKEELYYIPSTQYGFVSFYAYNYSNKIIADKIYVFELANKMEITANIVP